MSRLDTRIIKKTPLDQETVLKVSRNEAMCRIFVEFSSTSFKAVLQKSFQDTYEGRLEADRFAATIKSTQDLKRYFGVK